ncbi:MAG: hypothetical protein Q8S40_07025, partial [Falsiroseomonas sp.]|nr:hypothetical protein [Falsiroseomonas sp.]
MRHSRAEKQRQGGEGIYAIERHSHITDATPPKGKMHLHRYILRRLLLLPPTLLAIVALNFAV